MPGFDAVEKMNRLQKLIVSGLLCLPVFGSPVVAQGPSLSPGGRTEAALLEQEYAERRSRQLADVTYLLSFDLTGGEDVFAGSAEIEFELIDAESPLSVDFNGGEVSSVLLNGSEVDFYYNGYFVELAAELLDTGSTALVIEFTHPYSRTGAGLYRFADPVDGRAYLYTDFEPYDANQLFPSFDQPDLKATYEVRVAAPAEWTVVTSTRESLVNLEGDVRHWQFPESAKFSTYIFSLHAGDYRIWESNAGDIPLRLMARQSMGDYVVPSDWFNATRKGFTFFEEYFDIEYPFQKYDQLIVPDFNAGAMENVAAVTFSERFLRRGDYTRRDLDSMESVVLHEMAHMWFGDLVTMRWWNGLWLNESFASYMSNLAAGSEETVTDWWLKFFLGSKQRAYAADERVTNHPIELPVANTSVAFANFDGITYGKGASVLKQLSYLIGAENFRQGVAAYLLERSYSNSELEDFIGALADAAGRSLDTWSEEWLYTKGLNTVTAETLCDADPHSIELRQGMFEDGVPLHEHKLEIAMYSIDDAGVRLNGSIGGTLADETTILEIPDGMPCPDLVFPNYQDQAYIKVILQDSDLDLLEKHIGSFEQPLQRAMLWRALWEGVRDARISLSRYADILLANVAGEDNPDILVKLLGTAYGTMAWYASFGEEDLSTAEDFAERFGDIAWESIQAAEPGGDMQKFWFDSLVSNTITPGGSFRLYDIFVGDIDIPGMELDQDRRWRVLQRLAGLGHEKAAQLLQVELESDSSDLGSKSHLSAQVLGADLEHKSQWLEEALDSESDRSLADQRVIMRAMFSAYRPDVQQALLPAVLSAVPAAIEAGGQTFIRDFSNSLIGGYCSDASHSLLQQALEDNAGAPATLERRLRVQIQEDERCIRIKALEEG